MLKPVKYIAQSPFCSYGPSFDSRFANMCKEDSLQLISSFHSEDDLIFAGDIKNVVGKAMGGGGGGGDCELDSVDSLLDALSGGEYRKRPEVVLEKKEFEAAEEKLRRMASTTLSTTSKDSGIVSPAIYKSKELEELLSSTASQIKSLHSAQMTRLSRPPPPHLGLVRPPSTEELGLADGVTSLLATMAKKVTPEYLVSQRAVMEALGVDLVWEPEKEEGDEEVKKSTVPTMPGGEMESITGGRGLDAPTTPVAKAEIPQNVFARSFNSAISFGAS